MERSEILEEATICVCGKKEHDYGKPEDNFQAIADLWAAYKGCLFSPLDVAIMMALLKIARIRTGAGTTDCFVDLAGYAACAGEIHGNALEAFNKLSNETLNKYKEEE